MRCALALSVLTVAVSFSAACDRTLPPLGQVLLGVDTDAVVPDPDVSSSGPALFDRLRIDVLTRCAGAECTVDSRDVAVDARRFREGRASMGVHLAPGRSDVRVRVRLYLGPLSATGEPDATTTIDSTVSLPPVGEEGIEELSVLLETDHVGLRRGTMDAPLEPNHGALGPSRVGTWPGARRPGCTEPPRDDEACVPGGAFWLGHPLARFTSLDGGERRLVSLSPFYMDLREVTVRDYRARGEPPHVVNDGRVPGSTAESLCTFTADGTGDDERALNCITWLEARAYCRERDADLPTEAEWELVASGLGRNAFVWGNDVPSCPDAVVARAAGAVFAAFDGHCREAGTPLGATRAATGSRDRIVLDGREVVDLAGNLTEFVADRWNRRSERCWSPPRVFLDPMCDQPSELDIDEIVAKGGSWVNVPRNALAAARQAVLSRAGAYDVQTGFRCVRRPAR